MATGWSRSRRRQSFSTDDVVDQPERQENRHDIESQIGIQTETNRDPGPNKIACPTSSQGANNQVDAENQKKTAR